MDRLGGSDQARLLAFAWGSDEAAARGRTATIEFILGGLSALIDGDCVFVRLTDHRLKASQAAANAADIEASQRAQGELWNMLIAAGSHPMVDHWNKTEDHQAIRMSDLVDPFALHRTEIWNQFWRPFGIEQ